MQVQKRTDTSFGNPVLGRRELTLRQASHRERVHGAKSSIDTRAPPPQPHLTLYGRDYAAKKKATTEAAFMDLKMIQTIARTMTRKTEVEQRQGPVSLNADGRKAEIYRVMTENHRLLDGIENCAPCMRTQDLIRDHKDKTRYIINSSHTMRLSGEYDMEISRIKREDAARFETKKQGTESRMMAARMRNTTGSVSLPSLTGAAGLEPERPQPLPLNQSAGATSSFSGGSKRGKGKSTQGEMRPSPGPPPQRREAASSREPAGIQDGGSRSTNSKEASMNSSPKRVSKKGPSQPAPAAVAASSGKRVSVSFISAGDDEADTSSQHRRGRRLSTPHHTKAPLLLEEGEHMGHAHSGADEGEEDAEEDAEEYAEVNNTALVEETPTGETPPADLTAQELETAPQMASRQSETNEELEAKFDEAVAALELAENSASVDQAEVEQILARSLLRPSTTLRISQVLSAHGWNGSGFEGRPDIRHILQQLKTAKAELLTDEAIAAVQHAENSTGMEESEVAATLARELSHPAAERRVSLVLEANGWNGSSFGTAPDLHQLLEQLQHTKDELGHETADQVPSGGDQAASHGDTAKQENADDEFEDEYEDEFIDASADSLNMSRTLKSHDAPDEAFEESATFEESVDAADIA